MIKIKITTSFPDWPLIRQTPGKTGKWKDFKFFINDDSIDEFDFWVVCNGLICEEKIKCNSNNTLFITCEPSSVKLYNSSFLNQFKHIITSQRNIKHKGLFFSQQALMWMVGGKYSEGRWKDEFTKDYDELKQTNILEKDKIISVVLSNKHLTSGHVRKNDFVEKLKFHFGKRLDVFGVGHNEIEDKWDAIAKYRYHLVLENSSVNDYWTEKLSDCYLAGSFPFYYGCKNINSYFPAEAYIEIDINEIERTIELIEKAISDNVYEKSQKYLAQSKNLVLDKYNIFPMLSEFVENNIDSKKNNKCFSLKPEIKFQNFFSRIYNICKRKIND